jgi:glutathione peroxidase
LKGFTRGLKAYIHELALSLHELKFSSKAIWQIDADGSHISDIKVCERFFIHYCKAKIMTSEFYTLEAKTPSGKPLPMKDFEGRPVLIVNTATKCGLAPQFEGLEELHQKYKDKGLVVLGFPCDQFKNQEPETNETMEEVCSINHGVSFQLTEKVNVNGKKEHPIYTYLKNKKRGFFGKKIRWNFTKFLIDKNGNPTKRYAPTVKPERLEKDILKLI